MSKHRAAEDQPVPPALRIVKGNPTAEDLAALTVVLASAASAGEPEPDRRRLAGSWGDPALRLRRTVHPGPGAWRAAAWY